MMGLNKEIAPVHYLIFPRRIRRMTRTIIPTTSSQGSRYMNPITTLPNRIIMVFMLLMRVLAALPDRVDGVFK